LKFEKSQRDPATLATKLQQFLRDPASERDATTSAVTDHYRATFNAVDRFDTYMGHIPWELKVDSIDMLAFISAVRLAAVNSKEYIQLLSNRLLEEQ